MWLYYGMLGASIVTGIFGQILLKAGASAPTFVEQLFRWTTIFGLGCYGVAAILYIVALRKLPMSVAMPSVSLSYVAIALAGKFIYDEPMGAPQIVGLALIMGGVWLLNRHAG